MHLILGCKAVKWKVDRQRGFQKLVAPMED